MTRSAITATVAALAILLLAGPSNAQQAVCGKRSAIVERLNSGFSEQPRSAGLASNGSLVEIFASKQGTWTIIYTKPGGPTCLVAVGDNWQRIEEPLNPAGLQL